MSELKLPKLPKTDTVRLTIAIPAELHERLELYAQVYSETYNEPVDLKRLLPHMLGCGEDLTIWDSVFGSNQIQDWFWGETSHA